MLCYRCGNYNGDESKACAACGQPFTSSIRPIQSKRRKEGGPFRIGETIALRYKVVAFLGDGPSGFIYRVTDSEPAGGPRDLILKLLKPELVRATEDRQHFERAVEAASKLQFSGIASVYGTGEDAGRLFVVSEYCHGLALSHIVDLRRQQQKVFTLAEAEGILGPLCRALDQVHTSQVHGALRPANIIVQPDEVNVTDFVSWHGLPREGFISSLGVEVRYLAPEARVRGTTLTPSADVFSLGVILRELLMGGQSGPVSALPRVALHLIAQATNDSPRARPPSAHAFYEALQEAIDEPDTGPAALSPPPIPPNELGARAKPALQPLLVPDPRHHSSDDSASAANVATVITALEPGPIITLGGHRNARSSWRSISLALAIVIIGLLASGVVVWWRNPALFAWLRSELSSGSSAAPEPGPAFNMMDHLNTEPAVAVAGPSSPWASSLPEPVAADAPSETKASGSDAERHGHTPDDAATKDAKTESAKKKDDAPAKQKKDDPPSKAGVRDSFGCLDGMVFVPGGRFPMGSSTVDEYHAFSDLALRSVEVKPYCIDRFEYPNVQGAMPMVAVNLSDARAACQTKGKRLCGEDEWERACKGPGGSRFPYGDNFDPKACNVAVDGTGKEVKGSGVASACRSGFLVADLAGNVAEWTESKLSGNDYVVKGGDASHPDHMSRCAHRSGTAASKKSSFVGVRCCADPR